MTDVGVRELKRDLSAYLKRAADGEEIRVTLRGRPVVRLDPIAQDEEVDPVHAQWEALFASGRVKRALRPRSPMVVRDYGITEDVVAIVLEDRESEDD